MIKRIVLMTEPTFPAWSQIILKVLYGMNPGLPPPPNGKDPYLRSRLEKFYADIEEYRPGLVRMEIEERKEGKERSSRLSRESEEDQKAKRKKRSGFDMVADPVTAMNPDGSYAGPEGMIGEAI